MRIKDKLRQWALNLESEMAVLYLAFRHKSTPIGTKIVIGIAVCYALSPVDLIPDFIPILGFLDDLLLLPFLTMVAIKLIPVSVLNECRQKTENDWPKERPKNLLCALPIVAIWIIVGVFIVKAVW
jgi:uncharacterized membrane protein YkvA (DUF1232 family)